MSTANELFDSIDILQELNLITKKEADNVSHCVDDSVYSLHTITSFIKNNPDIFSMIQNKAIELKKNNIIETNIETGKNKNSVLAFIPSELDDVVITEHNSNLLFSSLYASSKKYNIQDELFGYKINGNYYVDEKLSSSII